MTGRPDHGMAETARWAEDRVLCQYWSRDRVETGERVVPEETPIAVTVNDMEYAVMMASPADVEDFARGFLLVEGLIATADDIDSLEVVCRPEGLIVRAGLHGGSDRLLARRPRRLAGTSSCGLCGVESLREVIRPQRRLPDGPSYRGESLLAAMAGLRAEQVLNARTGALHAAAFANRQGRLQLVREDVGRHNALDKLIGAMLRDGLNPAEGFALLSSRCSYELVQKAAAMGFPLLCTASAPTALAVRLADEANLSLAVQLREEGFQLIAGAQRIAGLEPA